jgi:hypothetical protein
MVSLVNEALMPYCSHDNVLPIMIFDQLIPSLYSYHIHASDSTNYSRQALLLPLHNFLLCLLLHMRLSLLQLNELLVENVGQVSM